MFQIVNGYEIIGRVDTINKAKEIVEMNVASHKLPYRLLSDCNIPLKEIKGGWGDTAKVMVYQYSTLYLETFIILQSN